MTNTTSSQLLDILIEIEEDETGKRVPVAVFVAVLSLVGIIGNIHILVIFSRNSKQQSTYHVFVSALAVSDLVVCSTYLPVEIVMVMNPFSFDYDFICRLSLVNCYTWGCWTVLLILSIAIERYRHICFPMKYQISCHNARKLCILFFVLAAINAAPMGYISGTNSFHLSNATEGFECFINDSLENSMFPASYFLFLLAEGVLVGFAIIFLYIPVRRTIVKSNIIRKQMMNINKYKKSSNEEITCINTGIKSMLELSENFCENKRHTSKLIKDSTSNAVSRQYTKKHRLFGESPNGITDILSPSSLLSNLNGLLIVASSVAGMESRIPQNTSRSCNKITEMKKKNEITINVTRVTTSLIVISIIFFVTLIPFMVLALIRMTNQEGFGELSPTEEYIFLFVYQLGYLNHVVNSFIYFYNDSRFRKELKSLYSFQKR